MNTGIFGRSRVRAAIAVLARAAGVLIGFATLSWAWSSIGFKPTHQLILRQAYRILAKDPAFAHNRALFPTLEEILEHEGVVRDGARLVGMGPDANGNSYFSEHYFNPRLTSQTGADRPMRGQSPGFAPDRVKAYLRDLADPADPALRPKAAAWSAHFLADMFVPFHVNGNYFPYINRLNPVLSGAVAGPPDLLSYGSIRAHGADFSREIKIFEALASSDPKVDWFDPWYDNGTPGDATVSGISAAVAAWAEIDPNVALSSHVLWETAVLHGEDYFVDDSILPWRNPAPGFEGALERQSDQARLLAVEASKKTRDSLSGFIRNPQPALAAAIGNVARLWRSSISGLKVSVTKSFPSSGEPPMPGAENAYLFIVEVENRADDDARNVSVRARLQNARLLRGDSFPQVQRAGLVKKGESSLGQANLSWYVEPTAPYGGVVFEAIADYQDTPDLQFAAAAAPELPKVSNLKVVVRDLKTGAPQPEARVSIADPRFEPWKTNAAGEAAFYGLTAGEYRISAEGAGGAKAEKTVKIEPLARSHESLVLSLESGAPSGKTRLDGYKKPWEDYKFYSGTVAITTTFQYMRKVTKKDAGGRSSSEEFKESMTCESSGVVDIMLDPRLRASGVLRIAAGSYPAAYEITEEGKTERGYRCAPIEKATRERDYLGPIFGGGIEEYSRGGLSIFSGNEGIAIKDGRSIFISKEEFDKGNRGPLEKGLSLIGEVTADGRFKLWISYGGNAASQKPNYIYIAEGSYDDRKITGSYSENVFRGSFSPGGKESSFSLDLNRVAIKKP